MTIWDDEAPTEPQALAIDVSDLEPAQFADEETPTAPGVITPRVATL